MENAINVFHKDNLIIRAIDSPRPIKDNDNFIYDCTVLAKEFELMLSETGMTSVSTTLLIPEEHVSTYKPVGYLIDAKKADCFHICKIDSCSSGNIIDGDFFASKADFQTTEELSKYIKETHDPNMNEINLNLKIDGVIGLVFNEALNNIRSLKAVIIFQRMLSQMTNITYPIYMYNRNEGTIKLIELTEEEKKQILNQSNRHNITEYCYYLESTDEYYQGKIIEENKENKIHL